MALNRQTDENGKPLVVVGEDYSWVKGEVRDMASLFVDTESIAELGDPALFVREGNDLRLRFLSCSDQDRVYHRGEEWEFFFVYTTLFLDIGVRFPFSEFQCGVLNQLKCAPTQIHPNAWAFIRGFEILMEYLGTKPLLEVFFSFFQAKGVRKGGTVTLNSVQGKALFDLYRHSYKDFKWMFVKVTCDEDQFPFYLDEYGLERFPLYWYSEPMQILGMAKISEKSARMVEFLEQFVEKTELLSLTMLFKWDKEREYVERYLETTTGGLKNFFKNRAEKGHSDSTAVKAEEGVVVNQPPEKKRVVSIKRRRAEEGGSSKRVIDLTSAKCCGKEVSLEEVKQITEKQRRLHGYGGEEDLTSVWFEHFPISVVAEEHFQSKTDLDLIGSVDDLTRAQFIQVCDARLLCLGRYEELKARGEAKKKKEESKEVQKVLEAERKLQVVNEQLALRERELSKLKTDVESLKGKLQKLDKDKTDLEARVVELAVEKKEAETSKENHGYAMLEIGFERAWKQSEFFYPDLKFDKLDPLKLCIMGA
ncbi:hypothetical protein PIB30_007623 [Stylosanthes scabra]|uniref:Transposase (putative) gypsy type domain-containing protein n=1 Tax=Stylosanthes scabra TaxID=79078 RepID=A0ABU6V748_9FABA|nr:hypothetical protein [Stylosanthes scabra]